MIFGSDTPPAILAIVAILVPALAACGGEGTRTADATPGDTLTLLDYTAVAPSSWEEREPSSGMRLAELVTDPEAGEEGPQVVVFYFGEGQGGSVEANIERWQSQFTAPGGGPVEPRVEMIDDATFPTTVARFEGAYDRGIGMGTGGEPEPDQALDAAVVETPSGNFFVQIFGPRDAVAEEREAFERFVESIRPTESGG